MTYAEAVRALDDLYAELPRLTCQRHDHLGRPTTTVTLLKSVEPYFRSVGWKILRCKRSEADSHMLFLEMESQAGSLPITVEGYSTVECVYRKYQRVVHLAFVCHAS